MMNLDYHRLINENPLIVKKFEQNIISIYKEKGQDWLNNLPQIITKIALEWNLTDLQPINKLSCNYVLSGVQNRKQIILKLSPENSRLPKEAAALRALAGYGAIKVLNKNDDALLLEYSIPGSSLRSYFPKRDKEATEIFCKIMHKLHQAPLPQNHQFPHICDWLKALDNDWDIPIDHLKKARILKEQLLNTSATSVLLHGDLHHENILLNGTDWVVIDPHGVMGEPAFELGAFIRNPIPDLLNIPNTQDIIQERVNLCAKSLKLDKERIYSWCFVQAILGYVWCIEDDVDFKYFAALVKVFDNII